MFREVDLMVKILEKLAFWATLNEVGLILLARIQEGRGL
jgi:hypothetical protein